jgi:hypothetical protein
MQHTQSQIGPGEHPQYTREGLTEQLIETYEWALTLGDADAAVDAVIGIAELNGLQFDSVEVQSEIAATFTHIEKA